MIGKTKDKKYGDEFYTKPEMVLQIQTFFNIYNKKIYLPFDTEESEFYKILKETNQVMLKKYDDFLETPVEFLNQLADDGWEIVSNPPFSIFRKIKDLLLQSRIKFNLTYIATGYASVVKNDKRLSFYYLGDKKTFYNQTIKIDVGQIVNDNKHILKCIVKPKNKLKDIGEPNAKIYGSCELLKWLRRNYIIDLNKYIWVRDNKSDKRHFNGEYVRIDDGN